MSRESLVQTGWLCRGQAHVLSACNKNTKVEEQSKSDKNQSPLSSPRAVWIVSLSVTDFIKTEWQAS